MKRVLSFLLSLVLLLGCVPMQVLAEETLPTEAVTEPALVETTAPVETEAAETIPTEATEAVQETLPAGTEATEESQPAQTLPPETLPEETVPQTVPVEEEIFGTFQVSREWETLSIGDTELTSEDLFAGYVDSVFYGKPSTPLSTGNYTAGSRLTGDEAKAYKALVPILRKIAEGSRSSAIITLNPTAAADAAVTFSESYKNFDSEALFDALWCDLAYELYWSWGGSDCNMRYYTSNNQLYEAVFYFAVDKQFRNGSTNYYVTNTAKTSAATSAVKNAKAIVSKYAGKPDYDKLRGYCDEICALNTYNDAAADDDNYATNDYGPWQILYVFDKNSSTNVVCGGYAKAFQYLCDIGGIQCYYITGYTPGYHAWNIVTLRGKNYLVDVTNIDDGHWGADGSLFLAGGSGSPRSGYTFTNSYGNRLAFTYESNMFDVWGINVLTLSSSSYVPCSPHNYTSKVTKAATCKATGTRTYTCSGCGHTYTETIAKTAHNYSQKVTKPTCTAKGYTTYTCTVCSSSYKGNETNALGHDWKITSRKDADCQHYATVTYACSRCSKTKTEQITSGWSDWSTSYPTGIDSSRIQTKTQYRYRDTGTGWTVTETGTIEYVSPWPGGFNTNHSLYNQYNKTPKTASQTQTQRVTIHSNQCIGYVYWHWCRGSYTSGPIDRRISNVWTGTYPAFHAYFSTQTTNIMDAATRQAYQMPNSGCCRDSYWYYRLPVMRQSYTVEELRSNGTNGVWSAWGDTAYTASAYREVETRKVYRYSSNGYGQHVYDEGKVTVEPSGSSAGTKRYTCTVCGSSYTKNFHYSTEVYRVSGTDRCQTARLVANRMKKELGGAQFKAMIYTNGDNFADALAGSYLAARKSAPILLYRKSGAAQNLSYIKQNLASGGTVYILGGTGAVPASVESELKNSGIRVQRLSGSSRFDTNIAILKAAGFSGGEILVCTGYNFADSLSASATGKPILLVNSKNNKLTDAQKQYLSRLSSRSFTIIGGTGAVSKELETALKAYGSVSRLYGSTRYETSVAVAKRYFGNPDAAVLAYAQNFPDGLCGGPLAYIKKAPLILTKTGSTRAADAYADAYGIHAGYVLGGTGLISDGAAKEIYNLASNIEIKKN